MADVDDELLALVGNGPSTSRSSSPRASRKKRRRDVEESDMEESDVDAEGSEEEAELMNPYPVEGIYKDDADRERLLGMPELEREDELAARRDEITKRRQRADLAAMVRNQQASGKPSRSNAPSQKKARGSKKSAAAAAKKSGVKRGQRRSRAEEGYSDGDDDEEDINDDEADSEDLETEESDYERTTTRRGNRARKTTGASSSKMESLQKLKKRRAKVNKKRQGEDTDGDSSEEESSEYDEEAQEYLWRRAKERERKERDPHASRREIKMNREEERIAAKLPYTLPGLEEVNAARLRRDHFTRLVHRPEWTQQLQGRFARVNLTLPDRSTGRQSLVVRLVQIIEASTGEKYYSVSDQFTNVYCDALYGEEKLKKLPLNIISNSPVTEAEYQRWSERVEKLSSRTQQRQIPSKEATLDMSEDLEAYINRPFTEQDINSMLVLKKEARQAFEAQQRKRNNGVSDRREGQGQGQNGTPTKKPGYDEEMMLAMNEKHRKADKERIIEAERRNAAMHKRAAAAAQSNTNSPLPTNGANTPLPTTVKADLDLAKEKSSSSISAPKISSLSLAAADINVDLGDF